MKRIFYLLGLLFLVSCTTKTASSPKLEVNAKLLRSYDSLYYIDSLKHKTHDIQLSFVNKTNKPIGFWTMTCSWYENFIISNDFIEIVPWGCDYNFPKLFTVKPNSSLTYKLKVVVIGMTRHLNTSTTKFGLIFIDSADCNNIDDFISIIGDKSKQKVIWSNELILKR